MANYIVKQEIVTDINKLHERLDEVDMRDQKVWDITHEHIKLVKEYLYTHKDIICLCASQLGFKERFFCIKFSRGDIRTFINPIVLKQEGFHLSREHNESIPNKEYIIVRHESTDAAYTTPTGHVEENQFKGAVGDVFEQMNQMLEGVVLSDIGLEVLPEFDKASKEEQDAVIQEYLKGLKASSEQLQKEIDESGELHQLDQAIKYMSSVLTGETKTEKFTEEELKAFQKHYEKEESGK